MVAVLGFSRCHTHTLTNQPSLPWSGSSRVAFEWKWRSAAAPGYGLLVAPQSRPSSSYAHILLLSLRRHLFTAPPHLSPPGPGETCSPQRGKSRRWRCESGGGGIISRWKSIPCHNLPCPRCSVSAWERRHHNACTLYVHRPKSISRIQLPTQPPLPADLVKPCTRPKLEDREINRNCRGRTLQNNFPTFSKVWEPSYIHILPREPLSYSTLWITAKEVFGQVKVIVVGEREREKLWWS